MSPVAENQTENGAAPRAKGASDPSPTVSISTAIRLSDLEAVPRLVEAIESLSRSDITRTTVADRSFLRMLDRWFRLWRRLERP